MCYYFPELILFSDISGWCNNTYMLIFFFQNQPFLFLDRNTDISKKFVFKIGLETSVSV